jgi:hypothetical protein
MAIKISVRERLVRVMEVFKKAGGKGKKAMKAAKAATSEWALTVSCFQRARASSKPSVTRSQLQQYLDSKARFEAVGKGHGAAAASAGGTGGPSFAREVAPVAAGAGFDLEDEDDDDMFA